MAGRSWTLIRSLKKSFSAATRASYSLGCPNVVIACRPDFPDSSIDTSLRLRRRPKQPVRTSELPRYNENFSSYSAFRKRNKSARLPSCNLIAGEAVARLGEHKDTLSIFYPSLFFSSPEPCFKGLAVFVPVFPVGQVAS